MQVSGRVEVLGRGDDKGTSSELPPGFSWKPAHLSSEREGRSQVTWGLTDHGEEFGLCCESIEGPVEGVGQEADII